jgi:formamidopyrimidine-DNA glycosylase
MPELPEVERAAVELRRTARGKRIVSLSLLHPAFTRRLDARAAATLAGRTITDVERRGKHQLIKLDDGRVLHAHFRMTGDWESGRTDEPLPRFARAVLELHDGTRVVLVDPRALATLHIEEKGSDTLGALGPEPTDPAFDLAYLRAALARRRGAIKPALLDQRLVAGLGNIYAAEALWYARISPRAAASSLSPVRQAALRRAILQVLARAPAARYTVADTSRRRWRVYDREGKPCSRCRTPIARIVQSGRSTYFCPSCQRR